MTSESWRHAASLILLMAAMAVIAVEAQDQPAVHAEPLRPPDSNNVWPPDIDAAVPPVLNQSPCPLQQILDGVSERANEMVQDLQRFTATEKIEHSELRKDGRPRKKINAQFSYVAEIERNPSGGFWVYEYRTATASDPSPLVDTGTATYALIFHPSIVGNFEIRCEGQSEVQGAPAWQLRFEESPDPRKSFSAMLVRNNEYRVRFKGRAWIAADNYEVLRMQTDLVTPLPEIQLEVEHFDISYAPVEFANHKYRVWLPESASMHLRYRGRRYQRVHTFSHFQLFLVETDQRVKEPVASSGNRHHYTH